MEIKTDNTKSDYINILKYYYFKRNLTGRIIIPVSIILLISYNATYKVHYYFWSNFLLIFISLSLLIFLPFFLFPYFISAQKISKRFRDNNIEMNKISLTDGGINITTKNENKFYNWKSIKFINIYKTNFLLSLYNNVFYLFSENAFQSSEDGKTFYNTIQFQIQRNKSGNVNHLYRRGWLGLIPLVGAFVGIWLIIEGIFKYRNKKLTIIGIACIMFTVFVYSSMFYYFKYSVQFRKDYASFSKDYLTSLVKDVEFYKSQKGFYPDSLEELVFTDKMVMIYDPILFGGNGPNNGKFYYKKIGERYTVFSCGIDRIPNTSDDIFPSLSNLDTTRIGFIKPK